MIKRKLISFFCVCTITFLGAVFILHGQRGKREGKVGPVGFVEVFAENKIHTQTLKTKILHEYMYELIFVCITTHIKLK